MAITAVFASNAARTAPPPITRTHTSVPWHFGSTADYYDGGKFRITGSVSVKGAPNVPVARRVFLHDQLSGRVVRSAWSDADGNYTFNNIRLGKFYVVAFDHTTAYRAVIADNITPETMP